MSPLLKKFKHLGMNPTQAKAYFHILKNKHVNYTSLSEHLGITKTGTQRAVIKLIQRNFVKEYPKGNEKILMANDLQDVMNKVREEKKRDFELTEKVLKEIDEAYGNYSIKLQRFSSKVLKETISEMVLQSKNVFEFMDGRFTIVKKPASAEYKNINFKTIYGGRKQNLPRAKRVILEKEKNYAHLLSFQDKVTFITSNKENILIENEEVALAIQFLIKNFQK